MMVVKKSETCFFRFTLFLQTSVQQTIDAPAPQTNIDLTIFKQQSAVCTDSDYTKCAAIDRFEEEDKSLIRHLAKISIPVIYSLAARVFHADVLWAAVRSNFIIASPV